MNGEGLHPGGDVFDTPFGPLGCRGEHQTTVKENLGNSLRRRDCVGK